MTGHGFSGDGTGRETGREISPETSPDPCHNPWLRVRGLNAWYGRAHVLQGIDLDVGAGEIVALLGRNGAGRSTICRAIMGHLDMTGEITFRGQPIASLAPHQIARAGIGLVPENREIFPGLTTWQNLMLGLKPGARDGHGRWSAAALLAMFPNLDARRDVDAARLSGGEQQMLSICRTLMGDPDLVMIDEPAEGLSPQMTATVEALIRNIAAAGVAVLLVEQKLTMALDVADRVCVIGRGQVVFSGAPGALAARPDIRRGWLEV